MQETKKFSLKQRGLLYLFKSKQFLYGYWFSWRKTLLWFADSNYFYFLVFSLVLVSVRQCLLVFETVLTPEDLRGLGFAIAGIIGASIAIIFSFSTFILQSTTELFSTQYLNKFIQDRAVSCWQYGTMFELS